MALQFVALWLCGSARHGMTQNKKDIRLDDSHVLPVNNSRYEVQ